MEKSKWTPGNAAVLQRIRSLPELVGTAHLPFSPRVHVLDLAEDGAIFPHVDSVKFVSGFWLEHGAGCTDLFAPLCEFCLVSSSLPLCSSSNINTATAASTITATAITKSQLHLYLQLDSHVSEGECVAQVGPVIAGLSLLSSAVMRFVHTENGCVS